jgi:hypothetical protein
MFISDFSEQLQKNKRADAHLGICSFAQPKVVLPFAGFSTAG